MAAEARKRGLKYASTLRSCCWNSESPHGEATIGWSTLWHHTGDPRKLGGEIRVLSWDTGNWPCVGTTTWTMRGLADVAGRGQSALGERTAAQNQ